MVYNKRSIFTASSSTKSEFKKVKAAQQADEVLLDELSKRQIHRGPYFFHFNPFAVSVLPLWIFNRILGLEIDKYVWRIAAVTLICSCLLWIASDELRRIYNQKLKKRTNKGTQRYQTTGNPSNKGEGKSGNRMLSLMKTDDNADMEASGFAMFYNNSQFIALVLMLSNIGFQKMPVENNYVVSMILSAMIVIVISAFLRTKWVTEMRFDDLFTRFPIAEFPSYPIMNFSSFKNETSSTT